jgi:hypothetical protein
MSRQHRSYKSYNRKRDEEKQYNKKKEATDIKKQHYKIQP